MENHTDRIEWLDIAKGTGILLVVLGHCLHIEGKPFQVIFVFHMPLFLYLSGVVFREKQGFKDFGKKKAKTLLLPFAGFYLLGFAVSIAVPIWRNELTWTGIKQDLWLCDPNAVHNSSIWFLVCLFWVQMIFWFVERRPVWLQLFLLGILYLAGIIYSRYRVPFAGFFRLPMNLDVVPVAIAFFAVGFYVHKYRLMEEMLQKPLNCILAFVSGIILTLIIYRFNGYVNLHGLNFGDSGFYLMGGLAGTMAVAGFSEFLAKGKTGIVRELKKILSYYGRHSLIILGVQSLLIRLYIVLNGYRGITLTLYGFSYKHTFICFVWVSFVVCPLICLSLDFIKRTMRTKGLKKGGIHGKDTGA